MSILGTADRIDEPLLEVTDLVAGYGKSTVLHGVSFSIARGQRMALLGRNGAGKSTLLLAISRLIPIRSGKIKFAGEDITQASARDIVALGLVQVLQGHRVFGPLTVQDNLLLGLRHVRGSGATALLERAYHLFPELAERRNLPASRLSGGQQQMLALSQGIVSNPRLLMLDEPSYGLAPVIVDRVFGLVREVADSGAGVFVVEQLVEKTLKATETCAFLAAGKIAHTEYSAALSNNPDITKHFFG